MARILVVDDDGHIREVVRFALEQAGHEVVEAADGRAALVALKRGGVAVAVLDIIMPEEDGLEVCRRVRAGQAGDPGLPILFLSSRDEELDRVLGLELGADDYVTKPFSPRELVARVKAMLRRRALEAAPADEARSRERYEQGPLSLDTGQHRCWWERTEVVLTVTEFELLRVLMSRPGRAWSRDELVDRTWGPGHHITDRTVDSHIRRIRQKIAAASGEAEGPIETVYGLGYRLRDDG